MPVKYKSIEDEVDSKKVDARIPIDMGDYYETLWTRIRGLDYSIHETSYSKVVSGENTDLFINWVCTRKISPYVMFKLEVGFEFLATSPTEVMENGKPVSKTKAAVFRTKLTSSIVIDWQDQWKDSSFKKRIREYYDRFIFGRKTNVKNPVSHAFGQYYEYIKKLNEHFLITYNQIRSYFGMLEPLGFQET